MSWFRQPSERYRGTNPSQPPAPDSAHSAQAQQAPSPEYNQCNPALLHRYVHGLDLGKQRFTAFTFGICHVGGNFIIFLVFMKQGWGRSWLHCFGICDGTTRWLSSYRGFWWPCRVRRHASPSACRGVCGGVAGRTRECLSWRPRCCCTWYPHPSSSNKNREQFLAWEEGTLLVSTVNN